jgi:hypothetical protein
VAAETGWWSDPELLRSGELGTYDFQHFVYYLAAHDDREAVDITAEHEYLHHLLAYGTNYGLLISEARQELNASGDKHDRRLFRALVRAAVVVNEMVATYASVTRVRPSAAAELPSAYKSIYDRCARLVEHSFELPQLRIAYAIALGRCLMMVQPSDAELEAVRAGELDRLPESSSPDKRLDVAQRHLLSLPRAALSNALLDGPAETEDALLERVGADAPLEALLHRELAEVLDEVLPGIDDAAAEFRMRRLFILSRDERVPNVTVVETARGMTQQRAALWQRSPRPIPFVERPLGELADVGASGVDSSWTRGIYCYVQRPKTATEIVLLNLRWRDDPPAATYAVLGSPETAALLHWPGPLLTIADQRIFSSLDEVETDGRLLGLVDRGFFVHVSDNPVDFLLRCLDEGRAVTWLFGAAGYKTDAIEAEHGLHVVLYLLEGIGVSFFHFSNPTMTAGLELFTERGVADAAKVTMAGEDEVRELAQTGVISVLLDHPLVLTHARVGDTLPGDIRELSAASEQAAT